MHSHTCCLDDSFQANYMSPCGENYLERGSSRKKNLDKRTFCHLGQKQYIIMPSRNIRWQNPSAVAPLILTSLHGVFCLFNLYGKPLMTAMSFFFSSSFSWQGVWVVLKKFSCLGPVVRKPVTTPCRNSRSVTLRAWFSPHRHASGVSGPVWFSDNE